MPSESFAGISVPEGEPGELRSGASTYTSSSASLRRMSQSLSAVTVEVGSWRGDAATSFGSGAFALQRVAGEGVEAFDRAGSALERYAERLERAQREARRAIGQARDAQRRIDAANLAAEAAWDRAGNAQIAADAANSRIAMASAAGQPAPIAQADLASAELDRAAAEQDQAQARRELAEAREDLERARDRGREAEEDAREAAREVAAELSEVGCMTPPVPALGSPASPASPTGEGAPSWVTLPLLLGSKGSDAVDGAAGTARRSASRLGRELRSSPDRAVRSDAARNLPRAGQVAKPLSRLAKPLPYVGPALDAGSNLAQGRGVGETVARTGLSAGGAAAGAGAAGAACGAVTFGLAAAACGAGGAAAGGFVGDKVGDLIFGDD